MPPYPRWRYFPAYSAPPVWVKHVVAVFATNRPQIDSAVDHAKRMESNDVLSVIANDLRALGLAGAKGDQGVQGSKADREAIGADGDRGAVGQPGLLELQDRKGDPGGYYGSAARHDDGLPYARNPAKVNAGPAYPPGRRRWHRDGARDGLRLG